jgi:hypothetical protein
MIAGRVPAVLDIEADPSEEIDPFVKRVVTVKPGDVVIFKYDGYFRDEADRDRLKDQIAEKLGEIPFLVVTRDFDITVLKQSENRKLFVGLA